MAEKLPSTIDSQDVAPRTGTVYPAEFAGKLKGREKRVLGDIFGLTQYGVNLTTLAPGTWSAQRHWHQREDEFIFVVAGELTLIDNDGEHALKPGMCAGFKAGVPNSHRLENRSSEPATYVEVGTRDPDDRVTYPDVDMKAEKTPTGWKMSRKDGSPF